ncbi:MAG: type II secretion system protein [Planctomycetota bacterium]
MADTPQSTNPRIAPPFNPRQRGITAVLAMLFLMIFGSLAAAMAIVSQGNLRTADSHLKINRAMATAETGLDLMVYRLEQITQGDPSDSTRFPGIRIDEGLIHDGDFYDADGNAYDIWSGTNGEQGVAIQLADALAGEPNFASSGNPYVDSVSLGVNDRGLPIYQLIVPAIQVGPNAPAFSATMTPHPLPNPADGITVSADYDDAFYDRLPYGPPGDVPGTTQYDIDMAIKEAAGIDYIVSETTGFNNTYNLPTRPLDGRYIRVRVTAFDGDLNNSDPRFDPDSAEYDPELVSRRRVYRSIAMDFRLDKRVPYAILSRSRIMVGRNVQIRGNVGSRFTEVDKLNGHPLQVLSDFVGLSSSLDAILSPPNTSYPTGGTFHNELVINDKNGDNRIDTRNPSEMVDWPGGPAAALAADLDGDLYVSDFDYFLAEFDSSGDGRVTSAELAAGSASQSATTAAQLFELMDKGGDTFRVGYDDGFIDADDLYAKIRGQISLKATAADWNTGLQDWGDNGTGTAPDYRDFLQGMVRPDFGAAPLTTNDPDLDVHTFTQHSFDTSTFAAMATTTVEAQKGVANGSDTPSEGTVFEEVPFESPFPYDYYDRPVYENMVFEDTRIPLGTNALFKNCRFIGVTFIEVSPHNDDENFNYVGMQEGDGSPRHPDFDAEVNGSTVSDTKPFGNNIRFDNCRFEGPVVSGSSDGTAQPAGFTHVRNKVNFTGDTTFDFATSTTDDEQRLYERSSLLLPHMSVEMGSFVDGASSDQKLELSGAVVAGLIDMRGQIDLKGTLITTFEPVSGQAPVLGDTAPNFNTTLGYFSQGQGDLEANIPSGGLGKIRLIYDPTIALPDGIDGPIELRPLTETYHEGGQ